MYFVKPRAYTSGDKTNVRILRASINASSADPWLLCDQFHYVGKIQYISKYVNSSVLCRGVAAEAACSNVRIACAYLLLSLYVHAHASTARPTEQQLFHHVARKLGADWKRFAIYLGFEHTNVQQADREQSLEDKAFNILVAWRNGTGNKPKCWVTILKALKNAGLSELASEIKTDIEGNSLDN